MMWRNKTKEIGFFDEELNGVEDLDYWCRILQRNPKFIGINKILYFYQRDGNRFSDSLIKENKYYSLEKKLAKKIFSRYKNNILPPVSGSTG